MVGPAVQMRFATLPQPLAPPLPPHATYIETHLGAGGLRCMIAPPPTYWDSLSQTNPEVFGLCQDWVRDTVSEEVANN